MWDYDFVVFVEQTLKFLVNINIHMPSVADFILIPNLNVDCANAPYLHCIELNYNSCNFIIRIQYGHLVAFWLKV